MTTYRIATGHGVALVSLTVLAPQPRSTGVQSTRRTFGADSTVLDEAKFVILEYDFIEDPTAYVALLTLFGVNSALYANVTIYVRNEVFAFARYNGVAMRPQPGVDLEWDRQFIRNLRLTVRDLAAL
jgi:hypothetical protein